MNQQQFDSVLLELKQAEHAREQADILEEFLSGRARDAYSEILVNLVAENISNEEGFGETGIYDGEPVRQ